MLGGLGAAGATALLAGCSSPGAGRTDITFYMTKTEVLEHFGELIAEFNSSQSNVRVILDSTSNIAANFVRGNPPDIACFTYNLEMARFMERGALSDLSDVRIASEIRPEVQELVDQYATYPGRTSVIPWSVTAASVIYNQQIFEEQGLAVPQTWSEFTEVCEALTAAGITPIYGTYRDPWTLAQGHFDYTTGGSLDVAAFFDAMHEEGTQVGIDSSVSFQQDFREPMERMVQLNEWSNQNAASRGYGEGNFAMGEGEAAMYMQGPWALTEIEKTAPDAPLGNFPLPMTEDPNDTRVRVNLDLALWIPEASPNKEAAREFLDFLTQPEVQDTYNQQFLAFGTRRDAPPQQDDRIAELQTYYDEGRFYQGASKAIPLTIPAEGYIQAMMTGSSVEGTLRTMDNDWRRLALRS
ncbi:ABC transporter substrate-binding protein [Desertivibrio insolitus]|uniref:ABC transporter substrate-binding protein n=1 Tax=Herbiconiux sp. SYSU D00978 TaxID=2812562 RepID=UPI001A9710AB|nr:extracellular solute-binding protein [Herbiconiux sp. SYSU D00978]